MESTRYNWISEALKIGNINDRISFLEETILQKEDDYDELCDKNMDILNEVYQLVGNKDSNMKEYFLKKRKENDIQRSLMELRKEQEALLEFYNQQYKALPEASEFVKLPDRSPLNNRPGKILSTKEKLYLLERIKEFDLLTNISKSKDLLIVLPLITGINESTLDSELKDYRLWYKTIDKKNELKLSQSKINDRLNSLGKIKKILEDQGFLRNEIIKSINDDIDKFGKLNPSD
jgi:cystathionine beta-lyase family protein involved in aluminum resistance